MCSTITAHLDTPVVGELGPLDGPLSWAWVQLEKSAGREVPEITGDHAPDVPLPLETWTRGDHWGWCVSAPVGAPVHHSAHEQRRRPAVGPMSVYTRAAEHHAGLGPMKARNVILAQSHWEKISWHAQVTDIAELLRLLHVITHLGGRRSDGKGHVVGWHIADGPTDGWQARPMPATHGRTMRVRAPYWHPTERTECA